MTEKQPQVSDDGTAETAAEIAHFEPVESYIRDLPSSLTDDEKTLIAGNIRAFYATIHPFELDEMDRQMIDEAWRKHSAAPKLAEAERSLIERLDMARQFKAELGAAEVRAAAADNALQAISIALGGTDEWTDQETMIAYVKVRAVALAAENERLRDAATQAEACMSIVEPRSDKAEYLRILGVLRTALEGKDNG